MGFDLQESGAQPCVVSVMAGDGKITKSQLASIIDESVKRGIPMGGYYVVVLYANVPTIG